MKKPRNKHHRRGIRIGDITTEIARAKAASRVHGPFLVTCTACGGRYWPSHREEHLQNCRPPSIHLQPEPQTHPKPNDLPLRRLLARARAVKPPPSVRPATRPPPQTRGKPCPYCGKVKFGLQDHIRAKHPNVPPTAQTAAALPSSAGPVAQLTPVPQAPQPAVRAETKSALPSPLPARQAPSPAQTQHPPKAKPGRRACIICRKPILRPAAHLLQVHGLLLIECPHCFAQTTAPSRAACRRKCPECGKTWYSDALGKPLGLRPICPYCQTDFYSERVGRLTCPNCKTIRLFNAHGKPAPFAQKKNSER